MASQETPLALRARQATRALARQDPRLGSARGPAWSARLIYTQRHTCSLKFHLELSWISETTRVAPAAQLLPPHSRRRRLRHRRRIYDLFVAAAAAAATAASASSSPTFTAVSPHACLSLFASLRPCSVPCTRFSFSLFSRMLTCVLLLLLLRDCMSEDEKLRSVFIYARFLERCGGLPRA